MEMGDDPKEVLTTELEKRAIESRQNGLNSAGEKQRHRLLTEYRDVFRLTLRKGEPAKIKPMRI